MAEPTRTNLAEPGISNFLRRDQGGPGMVCIAPIVGAPPHDEQPPTGEPTGEPMGAPQGAPPHGQVGSQGGAQAAGGGTRAPRVKHDSQPIAGAKRTNIAVTVNSLRMISSFQTDGRPLPCIFNMETLPQD
jgi:hypothetical protein